MTIGIIGAGISGLAAAYELEKKGHKVTIFERSDTPGGLGTYIKVEGNYIERFYHHFFMSDNFIRDYARELSLDKKLRFYKVKTGVYTDDKIFPFSSISGLFNFTPLSLIDRIRCGIMLGLFKVLSFPLSQLDSISAAQCIKLIGGKNVYDKIWGPLLEGKFSNYSEIIPAIWFWGRIYDRSIKLGYFDGSVKIMFDRLITKIEELGGKILLNAEVSAVESKKNKVIITEKSAQYDFDRVVITTVSPIAEKLIKNILPKDYRNNLSSIDHLGAICLILELKYPIQSQYWLNICDKTSPVLVMVEHTNMIGKKYYGERTIVYLANYIHRSDAKFALSDNEVVRTYSSVLNKFNKKFTSSWILKSHVSRVPRAQTIFGLRSLKNRPSIQTPRENIYMINIDQMYPHDRNLNQGIELGKKVAALVD